MRNATSKRPQNKTHRARITAYFGYFAGEAIRPQGPIFALPVGARWCRIFAMKRLGFVVRFPMKSQGETEKQDHGNLQEIKVIEDEKHGQKYIDNHSSQNYNIEHF